MWFAACVPRSTHFTPNQPCHLRSDCSHEKDLSSVLRLASSVANKLGRSPKVGCGKCGGYWQAIGLATVANLSHSQLILSDGKIGHIYMREIDISHDSGDIPDASFPCATCSPKHYRMSTSISSPPRIPWHMPKYMSTKDWGLSTNSTRN